MIPQKINEPATVLKMVGKSRARNYRLVFYIIYLPLVLIEWGVSLAFNIVEALANHVRDLTLSLKQFIHAEAKPADTEQPETK